MPSSEARRSLASAAVVLTLTACASRASAQQRAEGFAVERFYPSAPGAGWLVMDALDMQGGLGGAMALTLGYSHDALRVGSLDVVSDRAFARIGFAATYDRFRLSLDFEWPLLTTGDSGQVGGVAYTAPSVEPGSHPDTLSDARIGFDVRLLGSPDGPFRLGAGVGLYVPNGSRGDYVTDGTYRTMGRALFAGDVGWLTYAGTLGVHVRPLDDSPIPGPPPRQRAPVRRGRGRALPRRRRRRGGRARDLRSERVRRSVRRRDDRPRGAAHRADRGRTERADAAAWEAGRGGRAGRAVRGARVALGRVRRGDRAREVKSLERAVAEAAAGSRPSQ